MNRKPVKLRGNPNPVISGTLDIGAGDRPIDEATVAADLNLPGMPPKSDKIAREIAERLTVIVDKTAGPPMGLPLKLNSNSQLRVFWNGNAADLPDEWEGKFSKVYSDSAVAKHGSLSGPRMGKEIASMLRPGGKVEIVANTMGGIATDEGKTHVATVKRMLEAGGLVNIRVSGDVEDGFFTFTAEKPGEVRYSVSEKGSTKKQRRAVNSDLGITRPAPYES